MACRSDLLPEYAPANCPCCEGWGLHARQLDVDDFDEVACESCDGSGIVDVCAACKGAYGDCEVCEGKPYQPETGVENCDPWNETGRHDP